MTEDDLPPIDLSGMKRCSDCERSYSVLESYGIPRQRAKSVNNGIQVFDSRMQKQVGALESEIATLKAELLKRESDNKELVEFLRLLHGRELFPLAKKEVDRLLSKHSEPPQDKTT